MNDEIESIIIAATGAQSVCEVGVLQSLWSGYGSIVRYKLIGAERESVIVKHISPPTEANHPRGWNTDISHQRKLRSYAVETAWYTNYASRCVDGCRVPECLAVESAGSEVVIVLEDLDAAGYPVRKSDVSEAELFACIDWLADFHACFLFTKPKELWESGTYWHLETRPDEMKVLAENDAALHAAAAAISRRLRASPFQTLVHGDAKLANFCFSQCGSGVAAVDFQYVGGGCGVQDLAYFVGSCLSEEDCASMESRILDGYFSALREAIKQSKVVCDIDALEDDWRALYPVAWTDFHRFLKGWSPGHWKINGYSERLAREVIGGLKN